MSRSLDHENHGGRITDGARRAAVGNSAFYTIADLAARWQVSKRHVQRLIEAGDMKATRIGRAVRIAAAEVALFEATRAL